MIRTEPIFSPHLKEALSLCSQFTHFIFTSKSSVRYWCGVGGLLQGKIIAIGVETAGELRKRGVEVLVAPMATQEGVIEFLNTLNLQNAFVFYPHSKRARLCLTQYLQSCNIHFLSLDLYDTLLQKPEPVPSLDLISEIIFTSPSTVEGFLQIFKQIPQGKKLTCIGPITEKALRPFR